MPQRRRSNPRAKKNDRHIAKIAKKVLYKNSETKVKMNHINENSFSTNSFGSFYDPMIIEEGTGPDNRIGNNISLSGYQIKGVMSTNATSTHQYLRMVLYWSKSRDNYGSSSEFFINSSQNTLTGASIGGLDKMYHPLNKALVTPVFDKVFKIAPYGSGNSDGTKFFNVFVKLRNRKITYENNQTGADNVSPRLHLAVFTAEAGDDNITTVIEMSAMQRLWYKDI